VTVRSTFVLALTLASCGGSQPAPTAPRGPDTSNAAQPVHYEFTAIDGTTKISSDAFKDRFTVIGFLTTYDVVSQAEARFLLTVQRRHVPKINVAALFLEPADNAPLVEAFSRTLDLSYPVAIADSDTIAGKGPFAGLHHVPSVVVLDRSGREVFRHIGVIDDKALEGVLHQYDAR